MPLLQFLPWCPISQMYRVGEVTFIPYPYGGDVEGTDELTKCRIRTIMSAYRDIQGHPVQKAALIKYGDKAIVADLTPEEIEKTWEMIDLACFSALARRELFTAWGPYCNADCFIFYGQRFEGDPTFASITTRRRDGSTFAGWSLDRITFSIPVHVSPVDKVLLDEQLLRALAEHRDSITEDEWTRWRDAIACFNQANTDNQTVRWQLEWVLLCGAFQRVLNSKSKYEQLADAFRSAFVPDEYILVCDAKRRPVKCNDADPLMLEWMKEFYSLRGDYAHGKLETTRPCVWTQHEHVTLASIAFPLVVKCLLAGANKYALSHQDRAEINAFEPTANENFLKPLSMEAGSNDWWWTKSINEATRKLRVKNALAAFARQQEPGTENSS